MSSRHRTPRNSRTPAAPRTPAAARAARDARLAAPGSHPLQSLARFVISLTVLVIGGLWVVMTQVDPQAWWVEILRYTPYLVLLVPALLALVLSIAVGWIWRAVALAGLLVVVFPLMGWTHGQPENGSTRLRVMSFNIKSYKADDRPDGYEAIVREIRQHDPDVLVMQDAQKLTDKWRPVPDVMKELLAARHTQAQGQYVIASKYPLRDCRMAPLSADPDQLHQVLANLFVNAQHALQERQLHFQRMLVEMRLDVGGRNRADGQDRLGQARAQRWAASKSSDRPVTTPISTKAVMTSTPLRSTAATAARRRWPWCAPKTRR